MSYEPKEGVDYIVDLYAVVDAPVDATSDKLKRSINKRKKEYHPDRLQGVAPEFQSKGERMAILLNKARDILLDDERRSAYDEIRDTWDGPMSPDGTPVITLTRHMQKEMATRTTDEIEATFTEHAKQVEGMTGYNPSRLAFLEGMMAKSGGELDEAFRAEYEDALLQRDRTLAIQELERSRLLGLPDIEQSKYVAAIGYANQISHTIEETRIVRKEQLRTEALGGVGMRLALLSGEGVQKADAVMPTTQDIELPHYFEDQAQKIQEIAHSRESISEKRLANFQPVYPEMELQSAFKENVAVRVGSSLWLGIVVDPKKHGANSVPLPEDIEALLQTNDYKAVIARDFNVLTFEPLEHLDIQDLLSEAIQKYIDKYSMSE